MKKFCGYSYGSRFCTYICSEYTKVYVSQSFVTKCSNNCDTIKTGKTTRKISGITKNALALIIQGRGMRMSFKSFGKDLFYRKAPCRIYDLQHRYQSCIWLVSKPQNENKWTMSIIGKKRDKPTELREILLFTYYGSEPNQDLRKWNYPRARNHIQRNYMEIKVDVRKMEIFRQLRVN